MMLTRNDDGTLERMVEARKGQIGQACEHETQNQKGEEYYGPGHEPVKSSVSDQNHQIKSISDRKLKFVLRIDQEIPFDLAAKTPA